MSLAEVGFVLSVVALVFSVIVLLMSYDDANREAQMQVLRRMRRSDESMGQ